MKLTESLDYFLKQEDFVKLGVKKFEIDAMPFRWTFAAQGGGYGFFKIGRGYIFELKKPTCRKEK